MKRVAGLALTSVLATQTEDRTITKVVKLLQQMLDTSKQEDKADTKTFAQFQCYCDDNELEKTDALADASKAIAIAQSDIERLQGSSGILSTECAKLEEDMAANVAARNKAQTIRDAGAAAFAAVETDLTESTRLVKDAIDAFAAVGADQTLAAARDHDRFMAAKATPSLLAVKSEAVQNVLRTVLSLAPQQSKVLKAFIQSPVAGFTGNYAAHSGEVVGILKNMKDTFERELKTAKAEEAAAIKAHTDFIDAKQKQHTEMQSLFDDKQATLAANDGELSTAKTTLSSNEVKKAESTKFLAELQADCTQTKSEYRNRNAARASEQAALAEAISILNSDAAFATFGTVTATSKTASFLQLRRITKHQRPLADQIESLLAKTSSVRVQKVASLVRSGNPFTTVLEAIDNMLALNVKEGVVDTENKGWCETTNAANTRDLNTATQNNNTLTTEIGGLFNQINDVLIPDIASTEEQIRQNVEDQKKATKLKLEATENYKVDVKNLQKTRSLLAKATSVLKAYYDKVETEWNKDTGEKTLNSDTQARWGQFTRDQAANSNTQGNIFFQLDLISTEAAEEEKQAHADELSAQHAYEDAMDTLVGDEKQLRQTLAATQKTLAEKKVTKLEKEKEKATEEERIVATKAYQADIFPGCNFILTNYDTRVANRLTEETALKECITLIKGTDTYQLAVASAHEDSLGDCKDICAPNEEHAKCKACLASVTVAGYCAGHNAVGCP